MAAASAAAAAAASLCGVPRISSYQSLLPRGAAASPLTLTRRAVKFTVRSMAENQEDEMKVVEENVTVPPPKPTVAPTKPKGSIWDILAFSGPGPERINGRLAMIGFMAAMGVELSRGQDLVSQVQDGGLVWFLGTSVVLTVASMVPLLRGVSVESRSGDLMSSDAELWNGRFAMLGLVALAFTEFLKGTALFV